MGGDKNEKNIGVIRADGIWLAIIILALIMGFTLGKISGYRDGVAAEKIGALEDIVFNYDLYPKLKKEATSDI